ncbi:MAG TPA: hypothetical protein VFI65_02125 [Streptosporangiaceae bacterium]|nr:hypothetical protein [Streptosporangiaceae bacterium]
MARDRGGANRAVVRAVNAADDVTVIVDVSLLRGIGHDQADGFWIDSGNNNWNAYVALLNGFGVTLPAGSCYSVGAGGHICGPPGRSTSSR